MRRRRGAARTCAVPTCGVYVPRKTLMCLIHWNRVSLGTQERVRFALKAWRRGGDIQEYQEAIDTAIAEARK